MTQTDRRTDIIVARGKQLVVLPEPETRHECRRCDIGREDACGLPIILSPRGTAHYGWPDGTTLCGIAASGENWWWPL